jgi:hypothetical protein
VAIAYLVGLPYYCQYKVAESVFFYVNQKQLPVDSIQDIIYIYHDFYKQT